MITDKLELQSRWDKDLLRQELHILSQEEFDTNVTGFCTAEINLVREEPSAQKSRNPDGLRKEDVAPAVVSKPGDL